MSHYGPPKQLVDNLTCINNALVNWLFTVNRNCIHKGFLGVPTGKNPEDSNLANIEAMKWSSSVYPSFMIGVIENISHSTAELCHSEILYVPH
jgi:hypothetical protein